MPQNAAPAAPPVLFGQVLGEAYRNAHALQRRLLAGDGTTFLEWVILNTLATSDEPVSVEDLIASLSRLLETGASDVERVVDALRADGRIDGGAVDSATHVELSDAGRAHHRRVREVLGRASGEMLAGFDPADIATAVKVLAAVRERAPLVAAGS